MANTNNNLHSTEKVNTLRNNLNEVVELLNNHIGAGGDIHILATTNNNGFMSKEQCKDIEVTIPDLIAQAYNMIETQGIPQGTTLWYYGDPADLPDDWELTSSNTTNPLYSVTTDTNGAAISGVTTKDGLIGNMDLVKGEKAPNSLIKTLGLYSIRKK